MLYRIFPLVLAVLLVSVAGCSSPETAAIGGAIAGGAAANTFAGLQADLEAARQAKLNELSAAVKQLDAATDEAQKAALQAKVKALQQTIADLQAAQTAATLAEKGTGLDWSDPAAVGGWGGSVVALILYLLKRKQAAEASAKYKAHKQAAELFMRKTNGGQAAELYEMIGQARARNGVS